MNEVLVQSAGGIIMTGKPEAFKEKPVLTPLRPPSIPHKQQPEFINQCESN